MGEDRIEIEFRHGKMYEDILLIDKNHVTLVFIEPI
jgi:hypothetical protein